MKVIAAGAADFIGANIIRGLNALGMDDVIAVDDLTVGPIVTSCRTQRSRITSLRTSSMIVSRVARLDASTQSCTKGAFSDTKEHDDMINLKRAQVHRGRDYDSVPGALDAAARLEAAGCALRVVINESGIARGRYKEVGRADLVRSDNEESYVCKGLPYYSGADDSLSRSPNAYNICGHRD